MPIVNIEAYFANCSTSLPALKSYVVPNLKNEDVAMSGALFGAFPIGSEFVINIYGIVKGDDKITPTLVHVNKKI